MTLREAIEAAAREKRAIGHFNISDLVTLRAIAWAAKETGQPVMIGTSEGERAFLGTRLAATAVRAIREEMRIPIYLNADHTHSAEKAEEAVRAGYDEILFDAGKLPYAENVRLTREVADAARAINPNVLVEGELGYIGSSSEILDRLPAGAAQKPDELTQPEEAAQFVRKTGVDLLAPAVGNLHGMLRGGNPRLDIERIRLIRAASGVPLVLHGGSGIADADFEAAIEAGVAVIHLNTEVRKLWRDRLEISLRENAAEVAPYKILAPVEEALKRKIAARLRLFAGQG